MPDYGHNLYVQRTMPSQLRHVFTNIQREQDIEIICLKKTCNLQNCQVWISSEVICAFICLLTTERYKPIIYKAKLRYHLNAIIKLSHKRYLPSWAVEDGAFVTRRSIQPFSAAILEVGLLCIWGNCHRISNLRDGFQ